MDVPGSQQFNLVGDFQGNISLNQLRPCGLLFLYEFKHDLSILVLTDDLQYC